MNSRVISGKSLSFPEILRGQIPSKITKNNSQGIIFVIISCQRVIKGWMGRELQMQKMRSPTQKMPEMCPTGFPDPHPENFSKFGCFFPEKI